MSKKENERALATLEAIDSYNSTVENINNQGSLLLATFQDPNGGDTSDRLKALLCASRITDSAKELYCLDGTTENPNIAKWLRTENINLRRYVPNIVKEIKGTDGTVYPDIAEDFSFAHKLFKNFGGERRGNHLNNFDGFFYDDTYILQRTVSNLHKSKDDGKLTDVDINEYETSVKPEIPNFFADLVDSTYYKSNAYKAAEAIYQLDLKNMSLPDFLTDLRSYNDFKDSIIINDDLSTEEFANSVIKKAPGLIYYKLDNGKYFLVKLIDKKVEKSNPQIKDEFKTFYDNANNSSRFYVYDKYDIYKTYKYKAVLTYEVIESNLEEADYDNSGVPGTNIEEIDRCDIAKNLINDLIYWLGLAENAYNNSNEKSRCEEGEPSSQYPHIIAHLRQLTINNNEQCNSAISYISNEVYSYIVRRTSALYSYIIDEDNSKKLHSLLVKRLTKNTGSLLIWYQTLLQFDDSYENIDLMLNLALDAVNKTIVTKAYYDNSGNNGLFNLVDYPNYIDISEKDPLYGDKDFGINDTIYILDGVNNLQINKVISKTIVNVKTTDYSNIEINGFNEEIKGVIEKTIPVTRLILENRLPKWCKVEDPSNILIMKKVK